MGKLSRVILNSLFISAARAETFQVTSCNDENDVSRPPALTFRIAQDHFVSNVSEQTDLYTFVDGPDGGYQERTIQQDELSLSFDSETDDILLSYTLALQPTSGFQLNADAAINFGGDSVVFQCRYARSVSATSQMTVTTPAPGPVSNTGDLTYSMSVDVGALGGDSRITISPNHNLAGLSPRLTSCRVNSGEHDIYPIHSFRTDVCFDKTRLNVEQTVFGETIEFEMKTFRFVTGGASDSADAQEQTISCDLHLEPSADIVQEQATDCSCYTPEQCQVFSPWSQWNTCSVTCGDGVQMRTRTCENSCVTPLSEETETQTCQLHVCLPVGIVGLKNVDFNSFVRVLPNTGDRVDTQNAMMSYERLEFIPAESGNYKIRSNHGTYLKANGNVVITTGNQLDSGTDWRAERINDQFYHIKSAFDQYLEVDGPANAKLFLSDNENGDMTKWIIVEP